MNKSLYRTIRSLCLALITSLLAACTAIPISSMYSLSKLDPMKIDPEQIRVAIRVNKDVNVTRGSAQISIGYKAEDDSINEEFEFDVQLTNALTLTPTLTRGSLPNDLVTVMSLTPEDARTMRNLQRRILEYKAAGIEGEGSFSLRVGDLCLDKALPDDDVPLTLFLKTETAEDYIVFIKTELHDLFSDNDVDPLGLCRETALNK